jgi:hypothetical protein
MEFLKDLFLFLKTRKKFWLIPLLVILLMQLIVATVPLHWVL